MLYTRKFCDDELYHHGILGMKWGVRRFQDKKGRLTGAGKKRYSVDSKSSKDTKKSESETQTGEKKKGLTDKQKKLIIAGAAVAGTALAIYGGYKLSQMYKGVGSKFDPTTGFRLLDKPENDTQCLSKINPGRIKFFSKNKNVEIINGSSANCMLCSTAYDLRKRGFDVHAGLSTDGYMPDQLFSKIYKDYKGTDKIAPASTTQATYKRITDQLKNMPDGSRGNIVAWWEGNRGGHSMIWENKGGNIIFKDGQTNAVYDDFANKILKHVNSVKPIELLRTDNLEINLSAMKKVINNDTLTKTYIDNGADIAKHVLNDPIAQTAVVAGGIAAYKIHQNKKQSASAKTNKKGNVTDVRK